MVEISRHALASGFVSKNPRTRWGQAKLLPRCIACNPYVPVPDLLMSAGNVWCRRVVPTGRVILAGPYLAIHVRLASVI